MILEIKNENTFVPEWNGNSKLPEAEQIKITYRFLLPGERKKYIRTGPIVLDRATGELDSKVEFIQDAEGIAKSVIKKIEGLSVKTNGKEKNISTVAMLYAEALPSALVQEIELHLLSNASPEIDEDFLA